MKNLSRMGNPILRKVAEILPTHEIQNEETQNLIADLIEAMHHYGGVGIAAPQIGVSKAVAILEIENTNPRYKITNSQPLTIVINPKITILDSSTQGFWEGCLSVPGLRGYVERPKKIQVDFFNEKAEPVSIVAEGFLATVFQHELDHLFGKLYIDHIKDSRLLSFNEEFEQFIKHEFEKTLED